MAVECPRHFCFTNRKFGERLLLRAFLWTLTTKEYEVCLRGDRRPRARFSATLVSAQSPSLFPSENYSDRLLAYWMRSSTYSSQGLLRSFR